MSTIKPLVAGNWKMNGLKSSLEEISALNKAVAAKRPGCDIVVCPPAVLIESAKALAGDEVAIGAQDCHQQQKGAFTGELSAEMLKETGADFIIVGHSERRQMHGEDNICVADKARACWRAGAVAIICIGETEAERTAGNTLAVLSAQLAGSVPGEAKAENCIIAYEPVWAIGTGLTPSPADVKEAHAHMRQNLEGRFGTEGTLMRLLYGGSVKPSNAASLLAIDNVNGALVGGASLKAEDFLGIMDAYQ